MRALAQRVLYHHYAVCRQCRQARATAGAEEWARAHVRETGHVVEVKLSYRIEQVRPEAANDDGSRIIAGPMR